MKKILLLLCILLGLSGGQLWGQRDAAPQIPLKDRLWYGLGLQGNYQGSGFTSTFVLGLAPMVGYKFSERFSAGPRVSGTVAFYRARLIPNQVEKANPIDWSVGVFARYRIAREFFAHVEYAMQNEAFIFTDASGLVIDREVNNAFYIGGGYSSPLSETVGLEISLNYYLNQPIDDFRNPLNYRFGINYRF